MCCTHHVALERERCAREEQSLHFFHQPGPGPKQQGFRILIPHIFQQSQSFWLYFLCVHFHSKMLCRFCQTPFLQSINQPFLYITTGSDAKLCNATTYTQKNNNNKQSSPSSIGKPITSIPLVPHICQCPMSSGALLTQNLRGSILGQVAPILVPGDDGYRRTLHQALQGEVAPLRHLGVHRFQDEPGNAVCCGYCKCENRKTKLIKFCFQCALAL